MTADTPYQPATTPTIQEDKVFDPDAEASHSGMRISSVAPDATQKLKTDSQFSNIDLNSDIPDPLPGPPDEQGYLVEEIDEQEVDMLTFMTEMTSSHRSTNHDTHPSVAT